MGLRAGARGGATSRDHAWGKEGLLTADPRAEARNTLARSTESNSPSGNRFGGTRFPTAPCSPARATTVEFAAPGSSTAYPADRWLPHMPRVLYQRALVQRAAGRACHHRGDQASPSSRFPVPVLLGFDEWEPTFFQGLVKISGESIGAHSLEECSVHVFLSLSRARPMQFVVKLLDL